MVAMLKSANGDTMTGALGLGARKAREASAFKGETWTIGQPTLLHIKQGQKTFSEVSNSTIHTMQSTYETT